jgi:Flp pilus assembly protein TadD
MALFFLFFTGGCADDAEKKAQYYQKGMEYVAANNEKAAIIEFRNAVQIDPKYAAARYQLGLAYLKTSQPGEAFKELERAASLDPANTDAQIKTAELYFLGKKLKESRAKVASILEANKDFPDAYALLAQIELAEGNGAEAEKAIAQAVQLKPEVGRYYIILGRILASLNQVNEAEAALKKAVELSPDLNNFKALVAFYMSQKKEKEAEQILQGLQAKNPDAPQAYIDLAMFYMKTGDAEAAEKNILAAIGKKPDSAELYLMLGNFYYKTRNLDKAEKAYQDAVTKSAKPDDNKAILANFYYEAGKYDLAAQAVTPILANNEQHPMASLVQAKLLIREQKNNEALVILDRLVRDVPRWGEAFYLKGLAHLNKGEVELSFNAVDQALKLASHDPDARTLMAHHLFLKRDFEAARKEAITVLQVAPSNFRAAIIFGKSLLALGKTDDAVKLFAEMESQAPDNIEILYNKAAACLAKKDISKATVALEKILTLKPDFTPALVAMSGILIEDKKVEQAIALVRKHQQESPKNLDYSLLLAGILEKYGSAPDEALKLLRQAQELAPDSSRVYSMTSALLVRMGKKEEAIKEYRMLVEKNPSDVKGHMALGTLLDQSGDVAGAKASYEKALELQPKFAAAANNLAWLIANSPEPDLGEALRLSLMAKEAFPEDPYMADTLGWIHYKRGSHKLALTQFAMATEKVPEMAILRYHLAMALAADGQKEQAKMELTKVLAGKDKFPEYADAEKLLKEISN